METITFKNKRVEIDIQYIVYFQNHCCSAFSVLNSPIVMKSLHFSHISPNQAYTCTIKLIVTYFTNITAFVYVS